MPDAAILFPLHAETLRYKDLIMSTFRNLSYALLFLSILSLAMIFPFSRATYSMTTFTCLGVFVAVFAVSLVALIASLTMYFHSKNTAITVL